MSAVSLWTCSLIRRTTTGVPAGSPVEHVDVTAAMHDPPVGRTVSLSLWTEEAPAPGVRP